MRFAAGRQISLQSRFRGRCRTIGSGSRLHLRSIFQEIFESRKPSLFRQRVVSQLAAEEAALELALEAAFKTRPKFKSSGSPVREKKR